MQNKDRACGRDDAIILYGARQGLSVKEVAWYRGSPSAEWAVPPGVRVGGGWVSITLLLPFIHRKRSWNGMEQLGYYARTTGGHILATINKI